MIFPTAVRLVERLYRAAVCQAIEQRWLSFSIGMELFIGGCTAARVVVRKDDRGNSIVLVIGGVHFQLSSQRQRAAAAMMLLEAVWDLNFDPKTNVVDTQISRLREKIDKPFETPLIHTVRVMSVVPSAYCPPESTR